MKNTGHNPNGRVVGYAYCLKCRLMYLRNEAKFKAIQKSCPGDEK
tara:strand:- start:861 stop:995 length:135 start_codon:yes stop_codon:yes gene_type:complete